MPLPRPSFRIEAIGLLAILVAGAVVFWQQRAIGRLASDRPASSAVAVRAARLAAQARVDRLESQLAEAPKPAAERPAAAPLAVAQIKNLQLRVDAARSRESIRAAYGPLIKMLALDPAVEAQFEGLLAQERLTARDALAAAQAQGIHSLPGYKAAVEEAVAQEDDQIGSLLNSAGFAQFDAYRQTLPEQETVAALAARLEGGATPLNDGQQAQLVQLIDRMEPPTYHDNESFLSVIGMDSAPLTPAMVSAAPSLLSPPQTSALAAMQESWLAKAELQVALHAQAPRPAASPSP